MPIIATGCHLTVLSLGVMMVPSPPPPSSNLWSHRNRQVTLPHFSRPEPSFSLVSLGPMLASCFHPGLQDLAMDIRQLVGAPEEWLLHAHPPHSLPRGGAFHEPVPVALGPPYPSASFVRNIW